MKTLPIVHCQGCKRMLEFDRDDLIEGTVRSSYTIFCFCNWEIPVPLTVALEQIDKAESPDVDEKVLKANRAKVALEQAGGNKRRAAQILGVSPPTVDNWLKHLPAEKVSAENT